MAIAILGWGSLIWDRRNLQLISDWLPDGPTLPIEFSRISSGNRLTLVIDPANGVPTRSCFAISAFDIVSLAAENLRAREECNSRDIGHLSADAERPAADHTRATLHDWLRAKDIAGVTWTALPPNFPAKRQREFSIDEALAHLASLSIDEMKNALNYIRKAPAQVQTPLRAAVSVQYPG